MAVGRTADSRMADAPVAVTCHPVVRMRMRCHRIPTKSTRGAFAPLFFFLALALAQALPLEIIP